MMHVCSCPGPQELRDYLRGDLDDAALDCHLDTCPDCRNTLETLEGEANGLAKLLHPVEETAGDPLLARLTEQARAIGTWEPRPGQVLGEYELLEPIARGGMGCVFKARHRRMNRLVAIKTIAPALTGQHEATARFQREVEVTARLSHPHIVAAHDAFDHGGGRFLVMEYVEGSSLEDHVRREGPLTVERAMDVLLQAARGLEHAHALGIVHRDVKPGNLLITLASGGRKPPDSSASGGLRPPLARVVVKVLDLGLARTEARSTNDLTGGSVVMGTAAYVAPEQALDPRCADARADIYSLGCTLYFLLTGRPPYRGESVLATLLAHRESPLPSLREVRPDCPRALDLLCRLMLAKRPQDRPASLSEVIAELQRIQAGRDSRPRRRHALVGVAAMAATLLIGFLAWPRTTTPTDPQPAAPAPLPPARKLSPDVELVRIKAGKFWMGATDSEREAQSDEKPRHEVRLTRAFLLGKFEVTQEQYQEVMGSNPSSFSPQGQSRDLVKGLDTRRHPVDSLSWNAAVLFCNRLSEKHGLEPYYRIEKGVVSIHGGSGYRLPTEAEWEYACRASATTRWAHGDNLKELDAHAWHAGNSGDRTFAVGSRKPNAWGLHDMHGNVPEWCWDRYDARYYNVSPASNPGGSGKGSTRCYRGGGWNSLPAQMRCSSRNTLGTAYSVLTVVGLRVARDVER